MTGNLGQTALIKKRRTGNPMQAFDTLPLPLRRWLTTAALPWSPSACRRIWQRHRAHGLAVDEILHRLDLAEQATLRRDGAEMRPYPPAAKRF